MPKPTTSLGTALLFACVSAVCLPASSRAAAPPTRPPTAPGTTALVPAGPDAEKLAKAAAKKKTSPNDAASNPTQAVGQTLRRLFA